MTGERHSDFLERSVAHFAEWVRFADAKIAAALVLLGIGLADLLDHAGRLVDAHEAGGRSGDIATFAFWASVVAAGATVGCAALGLFPRVRPAGTKTLYFFGHVAEEHRTPGGYRNTVTTLSDGELDTEIATQGWELARIAGVKYTWAKYVFMWLALFFAMWATSRIATALSA